VAEGLFFTMREADKSTGEKKEQDRINIDPAAGLIRKSESRGRPVLRHASSVTMEDGRSEVGNDMKAG